MHSFICLVLLFHPLPRSGRLNQQVLGLLSHLGVPDAVFLDLLTDAVRQKEAQFQDQDSIVYKIKTRLQNHECCEARQKGGREGGGGGMATRISMWRTTYDPMGQTREAVGIPS